MPHSTVGVGGPPLFKLVSETDEGVTEYNKGDRTRDSRVQGPVCNPLSHRFAAVCHREGNSLCNECHVIRTQPPRGMSFLLLD